MLQAAALQASHQAMLHTHTSEQFKECESNIISSSAALSASEVDHITRDHRLFHLSG